MKGSATSGCVSGCTVLSSFCVLQLEFSQFKPLGRIYFHTSILKVINRRYLILCLVPIIVRAYTETLAKGLSYLRAIQSSSR